MRWLWQIVKIRFWRHEAWAIRKSINDTKNSLFYIATTWIWIIALWVVSLPALIYWNETYVGELKFFNMFSSSPVWATVSLVLVIFWFPAIFWFFRMYFFSASIMLSLNSSAQAKLVEIEAKLKAQTDA